MDTKSVIEIISVITMPAVFVVEAWRRCKQPEGIGIRSIQLITIGMITPLILILAIEKVIEGATVGTLIGGVIGYALGSVADKPKDETQP